MKLFLLFKLLFKVILLKNNTIKFKIKVKKCVKIKQNVTKEQKNNLHNLIKKFNDLEKDIKVPTFLLP